VGAADLLDFGPKEPITEAGLRQNVSVGVQYLEAWLRGSGAVPLFNLMEDAATAEISRAQIWQWIRNPGGKLDDGRKVTVELFQQILREELGKVRSQLGDTDDGARKFDLARDLFERITIDDHFADFLTLPAYEHLN
jgi:malate synthase